MGKTAFVGWAIWQKLTFCLACAIVVTVLLGLIKLGHTHWRLRKYSAVAEKEKKEQAMHRQMSQRRRPTNTEKGDDIPFGVRALESGIEVEGVWVSRPTTPEAGSRQSSAGSLVLQQFQRKRSAEVDLERGSDQHRERSASKSTTASARPATSGHGRASSAERPSSSHASRDSSPDAVITKPPRSRHPPCSYSKYSTSPYMYRPSSTVSTLEGLEAIHRASTSMHADSSSGSSESSQGGNDYEPISASAPRLLNRQAAPVTKHRQQSADLAMLNTHRISLAAETGQLTPRTRKTGQSGDWSSTSLPASANTSSELSEYFTSRQKPPHTSPSESASPTNPFSTPKIDALPASIRRSSMPDVTPFAKFCQTAPPTPRPESSKPSSRSSSPRVRSQSDVQSIYASPTTPMPTQPQPKRSSFEKRESQVLRGEGTGFEVLKPGSLNPPPAVEHPMQRQRAAPPLSLHNGYRPRPNSADSRRKLQKKRRESQDYHTSSDMGRKSRNSVL
ncbi:hypothetical protein LTR36_001104 [Oleoguttula mirabilis]|uniref:Uncharacterized protein n=1 Tax=Oleoguttula mirabilis TaxID=1507867 RepID=A0AAV9JPZ3_9PEZI|nr:hypothetical protein LTR36_001104 [Oleoguttula mirabilis]